MEIRSLGLVVLNYNSYRLVLNCLNSINKYYKEEFPIVVVDNRSSDDSFNILSDKLSGCCRIKVIRSDHNGGYSYGNNLGLRYLIENFPDLKYLAVMNPDVLLADGIVLPHLLSLLANDELLAAISPLMIVNDQLKPERWAIKIPCYIGNFISSLICLRSLNPLLYGEYEIRPDDNVASVDVLPGSFFVIKKEIFIRIGLFDEQVFMYGEEIILGKRIRGENMKMGLSFRDYFIHCHKPSKMSLKQELIHLRHSINSHIYYNAKYNSKVWGIIDTLLLLMFMPLRFAEVMTVYIHSKIKTEIRDT